MVVYAAAICVTWQRPLLWGALPASVHAACAFLLGVRAGTAAAVSVTPLWCVWFEMTSYATRLTVAWKPPICSCCWFSTSETFSGLDLQAVCVAQLNTLSASARLCVFLAMYVIACILAFVPWTRFATARVLTLSSAAPAEQCMCVCVCVACPGIAKC
jgi:hypothetical protein